MEFEGVEIEVRPKNVRNLRLTIRKDGSALLTVPYGLKAERVLQFLEKNRDWLKRNTQKAKERSEADRNNTDHTFTEGEQFNCWGSPLTLHINESAPQTRVYAEDGILHLNSTKPLIPKQRLAAVNAWYYHQLRDRTDVLIPHWLNLMNEAPLRQLRFRLMTSRWGSCKPKERIVCLNTRLVFYPEVCLEEVIVHELCHLKEASHNARFHALMAHYLPDYKERTAILRRGTSFSEE